MSVLHAGRSPQMASLDGTVKGSWTIEITLCSGADEDQGFAPALPCRHFECSAILLYEDIAFAAGRMPLARAQICHRQLAPRTRPPQRIFAPCRMLRNIVTTITTLRVGVVNRPVSQSPSRTGTCLKATAVNY